MEAAGMWGGDRRDLKMEAAAMGGCLKAKEVVASEGADSLKRNEGVCNDVINLLSTMSTAEPDQAVGAGKKRDEAVASEVADDRGLKRPWEVEGGMLRLKKEADAAWDLWMLVSRPKSLPPKERKAKAPVAGKKMKVVKRKVPKGLIEYMARCPFRICGSRDEEYAQHDPELRKIFATAKLLEDKTCEYWDALVAQQELFRYAEEEKEVTDDEEEVNN